MLHTWKSASHVMLLSINSVKAPSLVFVCRPAPDSTLSLAALRLQYSFNPTHRHDVFRVYPTPLLLLVFLICPLESPAFPV